jgi:UDP-N-acetylglucosamine 4,6-dehydratase
MGLTGTILITGGSGTLGHAIVRAAEAEGWKSTFTIYSRSELRQAQMRQQHPACRYILGDVRDAERLAAAVAGHDLVIHAAAMKRLPECDAQPAECYATNVQGSLNVLRACQRAGVSRLIGISTDKACAATTAYGASKLAMEKLFCAADAHLTTCTLVRYGNVVGSNGSVVPLWREQAKAGRPLTITDGGMTRFWMAPSDAVRLIVYASQLPHGLIAVPKMGALSIAEMAAIVAPGADRIEMGLRFAEKRHEDLVAADEATEETATHYLIGRGAPGLRYTSEIAPKLTADQFRAMLTEAEAH